MNVLFVAPRFPLPADTGGKIRTYNLLKQVAKSYKTDLVCFSFEEQDYDLVNELEQLGISVNLVPAKKTGLINKIRSVFFGSAPFSVSKYDYVEMRSAINKIGEHKEFDIIHFDHIHMTHYDDIFNHNSCIVDEHNVEYKILERCSNVEKSPIKKYLYKQQAQKMHRFEKDKVSQFSACSVVSDGDKGILSEMIDNQNSIHVIPNGVDTQFFKKKNSGSVKIEDAVVFTGSMDWLPNDDAAIYFCEEILPLIWKINPNIKFYIVGKDPSDRLNNLVKNEQRIILTGRVDDVRTYIDKSKVFVVPLRIGGGTRLKILEALSMEKAVVSTSIGAEGIDYKEECNIVLADQPEIFAQKVIDLCKDQEKCRTLGSAGRTLVKEKYDWNVVGKRLVDIYEKLKAEK